MIVRSLVQARAAYYILWLTDVRLPADRGDWWVLPKIEQSPVQIQGNHSWNIMPVLG